MNLPSPDMVPESESERGGGRELDTLPAGGGAQEDELLRKFAKLTKDIDDHLRSLK